MNPTDTISTMTLPRIYELSAGRARRVVPGARRDAGYRADQIRQWIFGKRVTSTSTTMHDLPAALRQALTESFSLFPRGSRPASGRDGPHREAAARTATTASSSNAS